MYHTRGGQQQNYGGPGGPAPPGGAPMGGPGGAPQGGPGQPPPQGGPGPHQPMEPDWTIKENVSTRGDVLVMEGVQDNIFSSR